MDDQRPASLEEAVPMVLRRTPAERRHLCRSMTGSLIGAAADAPGAIWWELVDAAAAADLPPAAVALTSAGPGGVVTLAAVGAGRAEIADDYAQLLRALVAALRSRSANSVIMGNPDPAVVPELLAVGFAPVVDAVQDELYRITL
jgi:hypothetical protein